MAGQAGPLMLHCLQRAVSVTGFSGWLALSQSQSPLSPALGEALMSGMEEGVR